MKKNGKGRKRYRVIGRVIKPGQYEVPLQAVGVIEDLLMIDMMIAMLDRIDPWNITSSSTQAKRDFGNDMIQSQRVLLKTWQRYARYKLREYLAP